MNKAFSPWVTICHLVFFGHCHRGVTRSIKHCTYLKQRICVFLADYKETWNDDPDDLYIGQDNTLSEQTDLSKTMYWLFLSACHFLFQQGSLHSTRLMQFNVITRLGKVSHDKYLLRGIFGFNTMAFDLQCHWDALYPRCKVIVVFRQSTVPHRIPGIQEKKLYILWTRDWYTIRGKWGHF